MKNSPASYIAGNVQQFDGSADVYDEYRPTLPVTIIDILTQLADTPHPDIVVDIGCGTGLSTRTWVNRAAKIIGVEPNDDLRLKAAEMSKKTLSISYQKGMATGTNLPNECADIVTICQALHWVEPVATFDEVSRILRPNGIFAAIDYDIPSMTTFEICALEKNFTKHVDQLVAKLNLDRDRKRWNKQQHLNRMAESGKFSNVQEFAVSSKEMGSVDRIVGFNLSHGATQILLADGVSEEEIGLPTLRGELQKILGKGTIPMYFTYRARIGQK